MKTTKMIVMVMGITSLAALPSMARPVVNIQVGATAPPPVIVQAPPPAMVVRTPPPPPLAVEVGVPDYYVWDGYEYVGVVGDQYYYLGPGHVWMICDPVRLARWHNWAAAHVDWRTRATVNLKYRLDARGYNHPWHDGHHGHGH